ncbi:MAG: GDP-mannose 4,6-dehydratase [Planctomycetia bacterium]|nr:GDP-mannose 4,6-dehydratase [Planctomycetia bacterium]
MSILITGGAGFIGSHLIERLLDQSRDRLVCLDNFNDYYDPAIKRANIQGFAGNDRVTIVEESFGELPAMRRLFADHQVRRVVHLGAYAGVRPSVARPLLYVDNNIRGTLVLLETAREFPVERFLLISSSTVYGRGAAVPFREDQPLGVPMSPYGATKRAAELLGLTYVDLHAVPVVCLRPFSVYGPRLRPDLAMTIFTEAIATGRPLPLFGDGSVRRDFTHVDDINRGLIAALTADNVVGQTINLGHSEPVEIRHLIALLEDALKCKANIEHRPAVPEDMPVTFADLSKAERLLDYAPRVPLVEGVRQFVAWYRGGSRVNSHPGPA